MTAPLPKRIIKETERLQSEPVPGISAQPHDDNARYFDVWVEGPGGSCYEGMFGPIWRERHERMSWLRCNRRSL
jgi:ubiquitin-protein ligase